MSRTLDLFNVVPDLRTAANEWFGNLSGEERVWFDAMSAGAHVDVLTDRQAELDRISRARAKGLEIIDNNGKRLWYRRGTREELQRVLGRGNRIEGFTVDQLDGSHVLRIATEPKTVGELGAYEKKKASTTGPRRLMTEGEISLILKLSACSFAPASWDKRFVRDMVHEASQLNPLITEKQAEQLPRLEHKYRKQLATKAGHG